MKEYKHPHLGRAAIILATLIWGTSFVILKNALDNIGTLHLLAYRFTIAAVLLFLISIKFLKDFSAEYLKGGALMGLAIAAAYILQTYGLYYTTPGKNAFLTTTYCILTPFLAWLFLKKRPAVITFVAAIVCLTGVAFISLDTPGEINIGDVLTIFCGLFYAIHIIFTDRFAGDKNIFMLLAVQFGTSAIIIWIAAAIFEEPCTIFVQGVFWPVMFLAVFCSVINYVLQTFGQNNLPPSQSAILLTLESVFGVIVSVIFYKEILSVRVITGFILMFLGVLLSERGSEWMAKLKKQKN